MAQTHAVAVLVENVFAIEKRGIVAIGKLADPQRARFYIGDRVEVRRRDGSVVRTTIAGVPMGMLAIDKAEVMLHGVNTFDVQPGDEVWLGTGSA